MHAEVNKTTTQINQTASNFPLSIRESSWNKSKETRRSENIESWQQNTDTGRIYRAHYWSNRSKPH